jgi:hypothetical protein
LSMPTIAESAPSSSTMSEFDSAASRRHPHRTFGCDPINILDPWIVFCKFFYLERFGSFRCASMFSASMFSASMFSASPPADPLTLMRTAKHLWTRTCTAYFAATQSTPCTSQLFAASFSTLNASMLFAAFRCFSLHSRPHSLHSLACQHLRLQLAAEASAPTGLKPP